MASTPTSQITRIISTSATTTPAANLSTNARFETTSYLVQGDTAIAARLESEKAMQVHAVGLTAA